MQAHVAALGQLFGGWRPLPWPHGVQEDDPEAAWATHRRPHAYEMSLLQRPEDDPVVVPLDVEPSVVRLERLHRIVEIEGPSIQPDLRDH
jgi:hypothetical protein